MLTFWHCTKGTCTHYLGWLFVTPLHLDEISLASHLHLWTCSDYRESPLILTYTVGGWQKSNNKLPPLCSNNLFYICCTFRAAQTRQQSLCASLCWGIGVTFECEREKNGTLKTTGCKRKPHYAAYVSGVKNVMECCVCKRTLMMVVHC